MQIPYDYEPNADEKYWASYLSRLKKAKHLSERMKNFLKDLDESNLKGKEKKAIKDEALKFLICV